MVTKEALIGFAVWLIAAVGVSANNGITQQEVEVSVDVTAASVETPKEITLEAFNLPVENQVNRLLLMPYKFGERSKRVERLQIVLGVHVDGLYGRQTRTAHIAALESAGQATEIVPDVKSLGGSSYRIPSDPEMRCPQFEPMFKEYGLQPVDVFSYIAYRESRCRPNAVNAKWDSKGNITWTLNKDGSIDRGLLQINSSWKTLTKQVCKTDLDGLFNLDCNLRVAKYLMDNSSDGLGNWRIWKN